MSRTIETATAASAAAVAAEVANRRLMAVRLHQLASSMTAHGLSRVMGEASQAGRLLWLAVFTCALLGVSQHTGSLVKLYLSYPVGSTVRQEVNGFEFPDVTLCDSMLKKFFLYNVSHFDSERDQSHTRYSQVIQTLLGYQFGWETKTFVRATYTASGHKFNMSKVSARVLDFLLHCEFERTACDFRNFSLYYDDQFGNCYTFRPDWRRLGKAGASTGLVMLLYPPSVDANFEEDRTVKTVTGLENRGFQMTIHQGGTRPDPHEFGLTAPVGMRTDLALTQTRVRLADTATRPCQPVSQRHYWNSFLQRSETYVDRLYDCVETEQAVHLYDACNCTIEGLIPVERPALMSSEYCHDLLGIAPLPGTRPGLSSARSANFSRSIRRLGELAANLWSRATEADRRRFAGRIADYVGRRLVSARPSLSGRLARAACAQSYTARLHASECRNECRRTDYSASISLAEWPDRSFAGRGSLSRLRKLAELMDEYLSRVAKVKPAAALAASMSKSRLNLSACMEEAGIGAGPERLLPIAETCRELQVFVSNTLVQVRVYPKTLTSRQLLEERSYELEKLFSDIGGILGLWMGASVITVFEFGELFAHLAAFAAAYLASFRRLRVAHAERGSNNGAHCQDAPVTADRHEVVQISLETHL